MCEDQVCVEAPDPCDPNPCGPGAVSTPNGATCQCTCPSGFLGDPNVRCIQVKLFLCLMFLFQKLITIRFTKVVRCANLKILHLNIFTGRMSNR